jgi:hypothetical protein
VHASAGLCTAGTTSGSAIGPGGPRSLNTVNRTCLFVARFNLQHLRALSTSDSGLAKKAKRVVESTVVPVDSLHRDRPGTLVGTDAARERARGVVVPLRYIAVNGAGAVVAVHNLRGLRTSRTAVQRLNERAGIGVRARTTGNTAGSTSVVGGDDPVTNHAINRAGERVAVLSFGCGTANLATVRRGSEGATARAEATTAS